MNTYASASDIEKLEIHKNPWLYLNLPDLPLEIVKEVLVKYPSSYFDIKNPSREVILFLVRNHGYCLDLVNVIDQDLEICLAAIEDYPLALKLVKIEVTEEMCRAAFLRYVGSLGYMIDVGDHLFVELMSCVPKKIQDSVSFRRFLIDHGVFWVS